MKREKIIKHIIAEQEKYIATLQQAVDRYKNASDLDENDTADPEDYAHQAEAKDMQLRYESLLASEQRELEFLQSVVDKEVTEAGAGALIETEEKVFFVCTSLPSFQLDGKEIVCISTAAPIFKELSGKKAGETFTMGKNTLKIKSVF